MRAFKGHRLSTIHTLFWASVIAIAPGAAGQNPIQWKAGSTAPRDYASVAADLFSEDHVAFRPEQNILSESFESGPGLFTPDPDGPGLWHLSSACEALDPVGHTPSMAFFYGVDGQCDYNAGTTTGSLLSPIMDLTDASVAAFEFTYALHTQGAMQNVDLAHVIVTPIGGHPEIVASNNSDRHAGAIPLADPSFGWRTLSIDLSPYVGGKIQVEFYFDTVDADLNANPGFYIDDVKFYADAGSAPATNRIHVDKGNVSGVEDGLTWGTAFTTIQEGINASTLSAVPYIWVKAGVYDESRVSDLFGVDSGSIVLHTGTALYGGFNGTETQFSERDWVANPTILDGSTARGGQASHHVLFNIDHATIDGVIIRGGNANAAPPGGYNIHNIGGGALVFGGELTVRNSTFDANQADFGGAIAVSAGTLDIDNAAFVDNGGITGAGGIFCFESTLAASETAFGGNSGGYGGAVELWLNSHTFNACTFSGNSGVNAGAVFAWGSTPAFNDCSFDENVASLGGGAVFNFDANTFITRCTLNGNAGVYGGAFSNWNSGLTLTNSLIVTNSATFGGAMVNIASTVTAFHCTVADNVAATSGGAIYNSHTSPVVFNSIFWNNVPFEIEDTESSRTVIYWSNVLGGWPGIGNLVSDPMFVGGGSYLLQPGSSAVDSAEPGVAPPDDLLGMPRPQGLGFDRGAYESL